MPKKIIIIGTRKRDTDEDFQVVWESFRKYYEDGDIIVSGGCKLGGDRFAEVIASRMGLTEKNGGLILHLPKYPGHNAPRWRYTQENYKRNGLVANETENDSIVIACVDPERKGGTEDTLRKIDRRGKIDPNNVVIV